MEAEFTFNMVFSNRETRDGRAVESQYDGLPDPARPRDQNEGGAETDSSKFV